MSTAIAGNQLEHTTIHIGNLADETSEEDIRSLFGQYGSVSAIHLIRSAANRRGDGCCYLKMRGRPAKAAINALDGKAFMGAILRVDVAHVEPGGFPKPRRIVEDVSKRERARPRYQVVSVEKVEMPAGTEGDDWYRYVVSSGSSQITGFHRGSLADVEEYATQCVDEFNSRSIRVKGARPTAPAKKK